MVSVGSTQNQHILTANEQKLNLKFVKEIRKRPVLYNFNLPGYSQKDESEKAWKEVAKEVDMPVPACKKRWRNLRSVFLRHMKLPKEAKRTKRAYYLSEAMQFTIPFLKTITPDSPSQCLPNEPKLEEDEIFDEFEYESNVFVEPEAAASSLASSPVLQSPITPVFQNNSLTEEKPFLEHIDNKLNQIKTIDQIREEQKIEGLKMFLLSLLPDLLKMSNEEVRRFKRKTLDTVDDILSSNPLNN